MTRRFFATLASLVLLAGCEPKAATATPDPSPTSPETAAADTESDTRAPHAEPSMSRDLGALLDEILARSKVPGLAAAIIDAQGVRAIGASGYRRVDEAAPLEVGDRFHLGSDTKAMTALLVARLVEAGSLTWDLSMADAFPQQAATMHPALRDLTLTQLLQHRGGVATAFTDFAPKLSQRLAGLDVAQRRRLVASEALSAEPRFTPGSRFEYTNFGYVIVGAAIEQATGNSWEAEIEARVFEPLGMASCGFGPTATGDARDQPWAHADQGGWFMPVEVDNPPFLGPAGTVHCTLEDWGRFARVFFTDTKFVSADSLARLTAGVPTADGHGGGYALGWVVPDDEVFGVPALAHDGSNTVNYATIVVMPSLRAAVLVAVNAGGEQAQNAALATALELVRRAREG